MYSISQTADFANWFDALRDRKARARIDSRIRRLQLGNPGHVEAVGDGISELKIDYGPGYRVYFKQIGTDVVLLLCGDDKGSQKRDIVHAKRLLKEGT